MPELLELAHLVEKHRMAQVKVGRRGVEAGLDDERPASSELPDEVGFGQDVLGAPLQFGEYGNFCSHGRGGYRFGGARLRSGGPRGGRR